jgi:ABC-type protease/lipase transport system fused ATPase/permease subunit
LPAILTGLAISVTVKQRPRRRRPAEAGVKVGKYLQSKLRNAEVIEALGMLGTCATAGWAVISGTWR